MFNQITKTYIKQSQGRWVRILDSCYRKTYKHKTHTYKKKVHTSPHRVFFAPRTSLKGVSVLNFRAKMDNLFSKSILSEASISFGRNNFFKYIIEVDS